MSVPKGYKFGKRKSVSEEYRKVISERMNGRVPWNKGIPHSAEIRLKISLAKTGTTTKKKGQKLTDEGIRLKMSEAQKKRFSTQEPWNKGKEHLAVKGEKNPAWKGGVTEENHIQRVKFKKNVLKKVLERDNYTCKECGDRGVYLQVDHLKSWADNHELRMDIDNCVTLCMGCHYFKTFKKPIPQGLLWGHTMYKAKRGVAS